MRKLSEHVCTLVQNVNFLFSISNDRPNREPVAAVIAVGSSVYFWSTILHRSLAPPPHKSVPKRG